MNKSEILTDTIMDRIVSAPLNKSILEMQKTVRLVNEANGWFDSDRTFGDDVALLHSEVSEAFEAYRKYRVDDVTQQSCESVVHALSTAPPVSHRCKPEGVGSELADILIRLLDTCERYGIDLEAEFNRKILYNTTRGYRHGNRIV